jgi:4-diphosphocytidyl-2-C-methyl-D-erythritol kinase
MSDVLIAPAKVNYYLAITGKREDGFHNLESLVLPTEYGDEIRIKPSDEDSLTCSDPDIPCGSDNLVLKAVEVYRRKTGFDGHVSIHLEKRIPSGAGLGGGSSDAATVLCWLNEKNPNPVSQYELETISAEVGSDCPLFIRRKPVVMKGRGEILSDVSSGVLTSLKSKRLVLFKPHFSISTVWAYQSLAKEKAYHVSEINYDSGGFLRNLPPMFNSFEVTTFRKYPVYDVLKNELKLQGLPLFLLSGSGSACFAFIDAVDELVYKQVVRSVLGENCFFEVTGVLS